MVLFAIELLPKENTFRDLGSLRFHKCLNFKTMTASETDRNRYYLCASPNILAAGIYGGCDHK